MAIYELTNDTLDEVKQTTFAEQSISERDDIQRLLRERIDAVAPDTLIIAEEFGEFEQSKRRIDLLGIDTEANLVVIELKRTEEGGHMELQAVRYAAMVSAMTFARAVEILRQFLRKQGRSEEGPVRPHLPNVDDAPDPASLPHGEPDVGELQR